MFRMTDPNDKKAWNPAKYQCSDCKSIIFSAYPGMFSSCKCQKCFVDQTRYYSRIGGEPVLIEQGTYSDEEN